MLGNHSTSEESPIPHSGSLTVILPEEDNLAAGACFTATLLKVANLPAADTRDSDSNEVTVSAHLLSALHGEAVRQAYLFGALDGCIYSCRINEGLKFTRLASFPSPPRALALLVVLPDVDGEEADATEGQSSEVELLVGVSDSGWLLSLHFLLKQ
nr:unnamed protein product [Spirometra erinaceieuropaei]